MDKFGIVANVRKDKAFRINARVWISTIPGDPVTILITGKSKGGRSIQKWIQTRNLINFRVKWVPEHLRPMWRSRMPPMLFDTKEKAQSEIDRRLKS